MNSLSPNTYQDDRDINAGREDKQHAVLNELLPVMRRLDLLLDHAIKTLEAGHGAQPALDLYRGLYIDLDEVVRLLNRTPGTPVFHDNGSSFALCAPSLSDAGSRLAWLQREYRLSAFDLDLLVIALAPELDLRYERIYAYLQDDVTRRRPSIDMALNLLCTTATEKLVRRSHFAPEAPLAGQHLLHLIPDDDKTLPPLLAHYLRVDDQIVNLLLGQETLDPRLAPFCQIVGPGDGRDRSPLPSQVKQGLTALVQASWTQHTPLRLYLQGPRGNNKRSTVRAVAAELDLPLLEVDLAHSLTADPSFEWLPRLVFREARLRRALLFLDNLDALLAEQQRSGWQRLATVMGEDSGVTLLAGTTPWPGAERTPIGAMTIPFDLPGYAERRLYWQEQLASAGVVLPSGELETLTARFRLTPTQIAEAVASGMKLAKWRTATTARNGVPIGAEVSLSDLFAAARAQTSHDLATLVQKIEPVYTWDDIVLPQDAIAQLHEICRRVEQQQRVLNEWGFGKKLSRGKGINALFAGASGTGKTMAAEIIANALGLELYKIDLSSVVSKYIGETEKNLERIFTAAAHANAILFFDEADALFGKRSEVRDAHDRYANIEISYLLQRMEEYEGVVILATNLRSNLDSAFVRRMAFIVQFPQPDEADRLRIWQTVWPEATPLAANLDLAFMAQQFKLSGGNIKNIALAAAFFAADDGQIVANHHLIWAARRELQKMGKTTVPQDFGSYAHFAGYQPS
jgi:SpoVK/Ycf46/Vps4 family AAA+-type ATPase